MQQHLILKIQKIYSTIHNQGANSNKAFHGIDDNGNEVKFDAIFKGEGQGYEIYRTTIYDDGKYRKTIY